MNSYGAGVNGEVYHIKPVSREQNDSLLSLILFDLPFVKLVSGL